MGVQDRLGITGRAGREQDHGDIRAPGTDPGRPPGQQCVEPGITGPHPDGIHQAGQGQAGRRQRDCGVEVHHHPGHLARPDLVMDRRGHSPAPPTGVEQHDRLPPVGELPGHDVPPAHTERPQSAGRGGGRRVQGARIDRHVSVDHGGGAGSAGGGEEPVEGRHVPRPSRLGEPRGTGLAVGGGQPHATSPAPWGRPRPDRAPRPHAVASGIGPGTALLNFEPTTRRRPYSWAGRRAGPL